MKRTVQRPVNAALMAALCAAATLLIRFPLPGSGGYANAGDAVTLLCGMLLGPVYGGLAAGIGGALADILGGYAIFAPATFLIKGGMAVLTSLWRRHPTRPRFLLTAVPAEAGMAGGYFLYEALILGFGGGAAAALPGNALQGAAGILLAFLLIPVTKYIRKQYLE